MALLDDTRIQQYTDQQKKFVAIFKHFKHHVIQMKRLRDFLIDSDGSGHNLSLSCHHRDGCTRSARQPKKQESVANFNGKLDLAELETGSHRKLNKHLDC